MNIKKNIGLRIKELRKQRHLSQEQLSEKLEINQNALSYIETGENFFSAETLERLLNALDVEAVELFNFKHLQPEEDLFNEIVQMLKQNPDKIREAYKIIKAITT